MLESQVFQDSSTYHADKNHEYQYVFLFNISHVICDGFSCNIIMNDIVKGIERQVNRTKEDTEAVTLPFYAR